MLVLFVVETSAVVAEADAEAFVEGDSLVVAACTGCSDWTRTASSAFTVASASGDLIAVLVVQCTGCSEPSAAPEDSVANKQSITTARDDSCIEQL